MNILIVDHDQSLVRVLRMGLVAEGCEVAVAHDGAEGLRRASAPGLDVVVLDVMLPELDGQEVLRALRAEGVTTPVLLLTARDAVSDRVSGLEAGADDYLTKPFAFDTRQTILARVWGYDIEVAPNAVEQYVHYLRTKLQNGLQVTTVRGAGYRLDVP